jgi:opacity protein-like surface antigen
MNKSLSLLLVILAISFSAFGQKWKLTRYEVHLGFGTANVFGDIGGAPDKNNLYGLRDIRLSETGLSIYAGIRYKLKSNMAVKLNLIHGSSSGSDIGSKNPERNFSFKTSFFEPSVQYEYYFIGDYDQNRNVASLFNRRGMINDYRTFTAYGFLGVGGLFFNPKLSFNGSPPDPTVNYFSNYSKMSVVIPFGLGVKYVVDRYWSIGFEFGRRITFTDYLDGISSAYSTSNDTYYFGVLHAIYKLETDRYGTPLIFKRRHYPRSR